MLSQHWKWSEWQDLRLRLTPYKDAAYTTQPHSVSKKGSRWNRCRICFSEVTCILPNRRPTKGFYFSRSASTCWMAIHAVGYAAPWVRCSPQLSLTRSQDLCVASVISHNWLQSTRRDSNHGLPHFSRYSAFLNYSCLIFMWQAHIEMEWTMGAAPTLSNLADWRTADVPRSQWNWSIRPVLPWPTSAWRADGRLMSHGCLVETLLLLDLNQFSLSQSQVYYRLY